MPKISNYQIHSFRRVIKDLKGFFSRFGSQDLVACPFKFLFEHQKRGIGIVNNKNGFHLFLAFPSYLPKMGIADDLSEGEELLKTDNYP